ncbi:hypothetical protein [Peribacillus sp. SCS-37]|uniref:hypothetical protein n=1 Tax=Paraperibacillus esterisolvens TaxID=3115296 RepID=UPI0039057C44
MIKIPGNLKYKQLPEHIQTHLIPYSIYNVRFALVVSTFLMLDLFSLVPLLVPKQPLVFWVNVPLMIFISIWAIWLLIRKPEDTELEFVLFLGCLGGIGAVCYFTLALKYLYLAEINSFFYFSALILMFVASIVLFFRHQFKRYASFSEEQKKKTPAWHYTFAYGAVPIGYVAGPYLANGPSGLPIIVLGIIFLIFSSFFIFLFTKYVHKYIFMKTNIHLVRFMNKKNKIRSRLNYGK